MVLAGGLCRSQSSGVDGTHSGNACVRYLPERQGVPGHHAEVPRLIQTAWTRASRSLVLGAADVGVGERSAADRGASGLGCWPHGCGHRRCPFSLQDPDRALACGGFFCTTTAIVDQNVPAADHIQSQNARCGPCTAYVTRSSDYRIGAGLVSWILAAARSHRTRRQCQVLLRV